MSIARSTNSARMAAEPLKLGRDITIATAAYGNAATTRICLEALFQSATDKSN
jgi:hypothetical protein